MDSRPSFEARARARAPTGERNCVHPGDDGHCLVPLVLERFRAKHALGLDPEVDTGSRKENASKQKIRASVLIPSEPIRLQDPRSRRHRRRLFASPHP